MHSSHIIFQSIKGYGPETERPPQSKFLSKFDQIIHGLILECADFAGELNGANYLTLSPVVPALDEM